MGFGTILSAAFQGLEVKPIQVKADLSNGLPMFHMVGYLSAEVKEAGDRVRTAIHNSGIQIPVKKTVVNLSPGNVKKRGAAFDLPIALSILSSLEMIDNKMLEETLVIGELGLDGHVRRVSGVLPIVAAARELGCHTCIVPEENQREGALVKEIRIIGVRSLEELYGFLTHDKELPVCQYSPQEDHGLRKTDVDFADVRGQQMVKRAAEIAVAGEHNFLMLGPPGSGKSMIAKRIPTILPLLSEEESLEITKIYSVMQMIQDDHPLITQRPFREVHHTATQAALIGGGIVPKPGEITLANGGVLFLDELPEFKKNVLEVLRQPLEDREIRLTRSQGTCIFPANFMLVAAMNPCPCGNYPDYNKCSCTSWQIKQYLGKISQPFLDRMDI